MRPKSLLNSISAGLVVALLQIGVAPLPAQAQSPAALAGQVTSAEEGVLVNARRTGGNVTVTVVSDKDGRYSFPAGRLEPGAYTIGIRAVGYEVTGKPTAEVAAGKTATVDLKLRKTRRLASQLSNAEWIISAPGTPQQKLV